MSAAYLILSCPFRLKSCHHSGTCLSEPWVGVYYGKEPPKRLAENRDVAYRLCCRWPGGTLETWSLVEALICEG